VLHVWDGKGNHRHGSDAFTTETEQQTKPFSSCCGTLHEKEHLDSGNFGGKGKEGRKNRKTPIDSAERGTPQKGGEQKKKNNGGGRFKHPGGRGETNSAEGVLLLQKTFMIRSRGLQHGSGDSRMNTKLKQRGNHRKKGG